MDIDEKVPPVWESNPAESGKTSDEANIARFGKKQQFKVRCQRILATTNKGEAHHV
jgi:hypothetical protein